MNTRVILVGRHTSDLPDGYEVVEVKNILWSTNRQECRQQLEDLIKESYVNDFAILLQNVPSILAAALSDVIAMSQGSGYKIGVIVSVPGERSANISKGFQTEDTGTVYEAVKFANGRAKIEEKPYEIIVTVDPVQPFVFSHIEWL